MITLFFFGRPVEQVFVERIGVIGFVLFYLSAIVIAILPTYLKHRHDAQYRSLGASGAVSAVLFAFILMAPWTGIYIFFIPIPIPAILYAVIYVGYSIWMDRRGTDNVNHSAHLWGAGYGVLFALVMEPARSEEHTSELQSLMRISYAGFLLKKKKKKTIKQKIKANNGTNKIKNNINKNKKLNTTVFKAEIVITNNKHITKHKKSTII